jgi:hypothetical protein
LEEIQMAFANTVVERWNAGGMFYERGTFVSDGGSTGGTITPQATGNGLSAGIVQIYIASFGSDGNTAIFQNLSLGGRKATITTAANDTGEYTLVGYGA